MSFSKDGMGRPALNHDRRRRSIPSPVSERLRDTSPGTPRRWTSLFAAFGLSQWKTHLSQRLGLSGGGSCPTAVITVKADPSDAARKGILLPYRGSMRSAGFAYNKPFESQVATTTGGKHVSFGNELSVTVYHYVQVHVDSEEKTPDIKKEDWFTSLSPFTLAHLSFTHREPAVQQVTHPPVVTTPCCADEHVSSEDRPAGGEEDRENLTIPFSEDYDLSLEDRRRSFAAHKETPRRSASFNPKSSEHRSLEQQPGTPRKSASVGPNCRRPRRKCSEAKSPSRPMRPHPLVVTSYRMM